MEPISLSSVKKKQRTLLTIFTVFTSSRLWACALCLYGQHAHGKVTHRLAFPRAGKLPARGNAIMEIVTHKCTRAMFLLAETCAEMRIWKVGLAHGTVYRLAWYQSNICTNMLCFLPCTSGPYLLTTPAGKCHILLKWYDSSLVQHTLNLGNVVVTSTN